ncbi:hypothetical protein VKT23_019211 [Stygiomarasmius scandens]|uniref:Uncharacterized protein n=1 Tax=Marasmiellus scandens TaxID=2682957 RepID=A0ABR1IQF6_9AGAR
MSAPDINVEAAIPKVIEVGGSVADSTDDTTETIAISVVTLVVAALLTAFVIYRWRKKRAARAATMREGTVRSDKCSGPEMSSQV